ncbi:protein NDUFAF4 homolog [Euwallacea fornicatus]|uniref:protein NDUFAF4 homolog n=1 Tax=Euwallacea fornicatus TaxID=995702 RepID=UPI00338ED7D6
MGRAISKIKHPFRDFNLESRTHKLIGQTNKRPSPRYEKDDKDVERIKKEFPEVFEASLKKDIVLESHLKDVYVTSYDAPIEKLTNKNPNRPLPQDKSQPEEFVFGHKEPESTNIPPGKTTLRNVLQFMSNHQSEPLKYTAKSIAMQHNLDEELVKQILKYYRVFEIYLPVEKTNTKATFAGPSKVKIELIQEKQKALPILQTKKDKDET